MQLISPADMHITKIVSHLVFLPRIISRVANWWDFCISYAGLVADRERIVRLRSGVKLKTYHRLHVSTVAVIFIKENYGSIDSPLVVIDIGANIGVFSVYAAAASRRTRVFAYEPVEDNYRLLSDNIALNGLETQVHAFKAAVAAKSGRRTIHLGDTLSHSMVNLPSPASRSIDIDCLSLKDALAANSLDKVDILKLDCEGAEFEILYGAPDDCLGKIREIRMEYHNQNGAQDNIDALITFMQSKGRRVTYLRRGSDGYTGNVWFR
jgi:FkbM family methyltransferase